MIRTIGLGLVRHALTAAGAGLVAHGLIDPAQADIITGQAEAIVGVGTVLGSVTWFAIERYLAARFAPKAA